MRIQTYDRMATLTAGQCQDRIANAPNSRTTSAATSAATISADALPWHGANHRTKSVLSTRPLLPVKDRLKLSTNIFLMPSDGPSSKPPCCGNFTYTLEESRESFGRDGLIIDAPTILP